MTGHATSASATRIMNLVATILLAMGLLAFAVFHFQPIIAYADPSWAGKSHKDGWETWPMLFEFLKGTDFSDTMSVIGASAFLCGSLSITASPFLTPVLKVSRPAWWAVTIASGLAAAGFVGMVLSDPPDPDFCTYGPGVSCLLSAFALNFTGLLFVRRHLHPTNGPPP